MSGFILLGDYLRLIVAIVLPSVIWTSKNCAGFSGKTQLLYAISITSSYLYSSFTSYRPRSETEKKCICVLATWLTVYLMYKKFKDTYNRHEDSFKIKYLILPVAILAVIFNQGFSLQAVKFVYSELLKFRFSYINTFWSFGLFLEAVAILPQLWMFYRDKTNTEKTRSIVFYYIYAMWAYRGFYTISLTYESGPHADGFIDFSACLQFVIYLAFLFAYMLRGLPSNDETEVTDKATAALYI
ncbi:ER lumen protein-retaining receptor erd-2.1-like [Planococcus citri]|uniref:ER lumen protein-retaining receptor erd-2.1-like n=1 Tax=Planococcus citri TaxID=170843 RepID=UPI0031FA101A